MADENLTPESSPTAAAPAAAQAPLTKIPEAEMYKVANAALRLNNVLLQERILQYDKQTIQIELQAATDAVGKKYGLDPSKHRVLPDGTIVPANHPLVAGQRPAGM